MTTNVNLGFVAAAGGTVDVITATYSPAPSALVDKMLLWFRATGANTSTTPTFSPNGLTAHTIVKNGGQALVAGDIPAAGAIVGVVYDLANTRWEIIGVVGGNSGWTDDGSNVRLTTATDTVQIHSQLTVGGNATAAGKILFLEDTDNGSNSITLTAPSSVASNRNISIPDVNGSMAVTSGSTAQKRIPFFDSFGSLASSGSFTFDNTVSPSVFTAGGIQISSAGSGSASFGGLTTATGTGSTTLGLNATVGSNNNSVVIGNGATATAANQVVIGSDSVGYSNGYMGNGVTAATPLSTIINATGGSGTDIAGASVTIAGGKASGAATPGSVKIQTSVAGASGTTLQSLADIHEWTQDKSISKKGERHTTRVHTAAGAVTVAVTDYIVIVNKTVGAATTANLPASPTLGDTYIIKDGKGDANSNNITVTPAVGTIDGAATYPMTVNYQAATFVYNGTEWNVL